MAEQNVLSEVVTNLEAAERQLCVAVRLFFERKDLIAVHALAAAADDVLRKLGKARGVSGIFDFADKVIRPDRIKEWRHRARESQNFFKHAPNEKVVFYYGATKFLLFDAVYLCSNIAGRRIPEIHVFLTWFMIRHPSYFTIEDPAVKTALETKQFDVDDFEVMLSAIDHLAKVGVPKVNKKST
jgi:hypothetical protein